MKTSRWLVCAMSILVIVSGPSWAGPEPRLAGMITGLDSSGESFTVEVMPPWRGPDTRTVPYVIAILPTTRVVLIQRVAPTEQGQDGWLGGFLSSPMSASQLRPGDYVAITSEQQGERVIATSIDVVRPG